MMVLQPQKLSLFCSLYSTHFHLQSNSTANDTNRQLHTMTTSVHKERIANTY